MLCWKQADSGLLPGIMYMGCRPLTCQYLPCSRTMVVARASAEDRRSQVRSTSVMAPCRGLLANNLLYQEQRRALGCPLS